MFTLTSSKNLVIHFIILTKATITSKLAHMALKGCCINIMLNLHQNLQFLATMRLNQNEAETLLNLGLLY